MDDFFSIPKSYIPTFSAARTVTDAQLEAAKTVVRQEIISASVASKSVLSEESSKITTDDASNALRETASSDVNGTVSVEDTESNSATAAVSTETAPVTEAAREAEPDAVPADEVAVQASALETVEVAQTVDTTGAPGDAPVAEAAEAATDAEAAEAVEDAEAVEAATDAETVEAAEAAEAAETVEVAETVEAPAVELTEVSEIEAPTDQVTDAVVALEADTVDDAVSTAAASDTVDAAPAGTPQSAKEVNNDNDSTSTVDQTALEVDLQIAPVKSVSDEAQKLADLKTARELKDMCKKHNLNGNGKKLEMATRIIEHERRSGISDNHVFGSDDALVVIT